MFKRLACFALLLLFLPLSVLGEEERSYMDGDLLIEEVTYGDVYWDFPVDLADMDPDLVILANKWMLIDKSFVVKPLVTLKTRKNNKDGTNANGGVRKASSAEMQLSQECAEALVKMFDAADADGIKLYLKSAYRSWQTQNTMYYNRLKKYGYDDGYVSMPGASDHQTGLGCDIVSYSWRDKGMNGKFAETEEAQWMAEHCAEYGFVIRYPEDKVEITGIEYEPWHLRYVGIPVATWMTENGLCLEEFHEQLVAACEQFIEEGGDASLVEGFMQESVEKQFNY